MQCLLNLQQSKVIN